MTEKNPEVGKRGVIATLIDPQNRVITNADDFTQGERLAQEERAIDRLKDRIITSWCSPFFARLMDQDARDAIMRSLINHGCQTTLVLVGYDENPEVGSD